MPRHKTPERIAANREHHLTFYVHDYEELRQKVITDIFNLAKITKRLNGLHESMKKIDTNRRQHAADMGVSIEESDKTYDFDALMSAIPKIIEEMRDYEKQFGVDFTTIR